MHDLCQGLTELLFVCVTRFFCCRKQFPVNFSMPGPDAGILVGYTFSHFGTCCVRSCASSDLQFAALDFARQTVSFDVKEITLSVPKW